MAIPVASDEPVRIRFGGGINSRASTDEIQPQECTEASRNFVLDFSNSQFRSREYFDLAGTAPNSGEIRGWAQLQKRDGTITTLIQAGTQVYETDFTTWTSVGTVSATAQLRGPQSANWLLDEIVLIGDLNLVDPVYEWDGTTFSEMTHNLTGDFKARHIRVARERVHYGNVESNSTATPHMVVASAVSDHDNLSTTVLPSAGSEADAWYLLTPDLRPINALEKAFGTFIVSTENGEIFQITGPVRADTTIKEFYPDSGADGAEPLTFAGNDILYGRQGRIESLAATERFGDVQTDDPSRWIQDQIETYDDWTAIYNDRLQRVYFLSNGSQELWVLFKNLVGQNLSPWSRWATANALAFSPSCFWAMKDPVSGLRHSYMGDSAGQVFRLEGTSAGDAGSTNVSVRRTSKLLSAPLTAKAYDLEGVVKYRANEAVTATLTVLYQGRNLFDQAITLTLPAVTDGIYWNQTDAYWNETDNYWGSAFEGRLVRQPFGIAGAAEDYQVRLEADGTSSFEINEILLEFKARS